jgi:hypothetical protein
MNTDTNNGMRGVLKTLIEKADEIELPDNTRGKAYMGQITVIGKSISGAICASEWPDVYTVLSVGEAAMGGIKKKVLAKTYVHADAVMTVDTIIEAPKVQSAGGLIIPK